jgi:hypothetical protein
MGFTGKGIMLLNEDSWQPNLAERLERLYAAGMPHAIVVLPDCFTRYGGSQYINSGATGRYEDYVIAEIIPLGGCALSDAGDTAITRRLRQVEWRLRLDDPGHASS